MRGSGGGYVTVGEEVLFDCPMTDEQREDYQVDRIKKLFLDKDKDFLCLSDEEAARAVFQKLGITDVSALKCETCFARNNSMYKQVA